MGDIYGEWCQCDNLQCDRDQSGERQQRMQI